MRYLIQKFIIATFLATVVALDYPSFNIIINENPYPEDMFIHSSGGGGNQFMAILDPDLNVKWYIVSTDGKGWDFKVNSNNMLTYFRKPSNDWTPSGGGIWHVMDQGMREVDTLSCVNGHQADFHDIQYTESGGYLLQSYAKEMIDLPQTEVLDTANILIIQEFDADHNLIMEWKNSDHMDIMDYVDEFNLDAPYRHWTHGNSVEIDYDGNIILSNRAMSEVIKFDRNTGDLIWRLGGPMNDFTFIDDLLQGPNKQHDVRRLENGNIMIFDNGNQRTVPLTRVSEYQIDEDAMTATLVWQYSHPDGYVSLNQGCAQRLDNNNTLISWGGVDGHGQIITEIDYSGNRVMEIEYPDGYYSYKVRKSNWSFNVNLIEADINLDGDINIFDVVIIVNFILSSSSPDPFYLYKADLNKTGSIDILDILLILDLIL